MTNDAATLYCPNELCQAANPLTHKFCQRCSTPLPKRYLWVVGDGLGVGSPGEILADRYLIINQSVVFDTKPGLLPQAPEIDNIQPIKPYLRLIPYRLHIPQVYGVLPIQEGRIRREILLLEKPPLFTDSLAQEVYLYSSLTEAWSNANSMRQLNWLWQIAHLWQPLKSEGVVSSLLEPELLRVEGPLVRLLELSCDSHSAPELPKLGEFWQQLRRYAKPAIAPFVDQISNLLIEGEINSPELLIAFLDRGLAELAKFQTPTIQIITKTDTGPRRERNEDACYPPSDTILSKPPQPTVLAIVCDGIGGHEGGNVASNLAIETIQQQVQQLTKVPSDHIEPSLLLADLEMAVASVNDKISQRNDSENRHGRKRMGTTLVMALPIAHEIYITHVGDSRAYWITHHGCYQVTLDDDVASREVRLGYAVYREAVQQSGSGSLVQALGMSPSSSLHPTAQRFICDEDAVFLLTTDGLSDFDRVEDYWDTEILPILTEKSQLVNVAEQLVEIANTKNGHDNVTIALVHYQVRYVEPESAIQVVIPDSTAIRTATPAANATQQILQEGNPDQKTKVIPANFTSNMTKLPLTVIVPLFLVVASGLLGYGVMRWRNPATNPVATPTVPATSSTAQQERSLANLAVGAVIKTKNEITLPNQVKLPPDTFLEVVEKTTNSAVDSGDDQVSLDVCANPTQPQKILEKPVLIKSSELANWQVDVLPGDADTPCNSSSVDSPSPAPNTPSTNTR
ncbi:MULTISPECIES: protein phosphatase 2C domain-containing protein [unclassified Anabaena]|uniref:protein phosphatase 2C domain-containing protein n=1 Tax=unclassified Anabaena TaxID=2619674 RepID=UPI000829652C|nr:MULTISPECIES: protein phosphatase 2C domain-containing protein [unclassified Anabaena]